METPQRKGAEPSTYRYHTALPIQYSSLSAFYSSILSFCASTMDSEFQFPPNGAAIGSPAPASNAFFFQAGMSSSWCSCLCS